VSSVLACQLCNAVPTEKRTTGRKHGERWSVSRVDRSAYARRLAQWLQRGSYELDIVESIFIKDVELHDA